MIIILEFITFIIIKTREWGDHSNSFSKNIWQRTGEHLLWWYSGGHGAQMSFIVLYFLVCYQIIIICTKPFTIMTFLMSHLIIDHGWTFYRLIFFSLTGEAHFSIFLNFSWCIFYKNIRLQGSPIILTSFSWRPRIFP